MEISGLFSVGLAAEQDFSIAQVHSAAQVGSGPAFSEDGSLEVLSTPSLVAFMECLAFRMLEERLPADLTSLGISVQVEHTAPTLVGRSVRVTAEICAVEGRRVTFQLQAWDDQEQVGTCTHTRVVVGRDAFRQRLAAKRDR